MNAAGRRYRYAADWLSERTAVSSLGSDFIDGELVVDRSELVVVLQHARRR